MFGRTKRDGVFRFYDGSKWRATDPLRIHRLINEHGGKEWEHWVGQLDMLDDPPAKFKLTESIRQERQNKGMEGAHKVADLARKVFAVSQVDDGGLTDAECVRLFGDYIRYAARIAEEYRSFRMPPPVTASVGGG